MLITLFTDASVSGCRMFGAWAAWAKLNGMTMRASGVFKESPRDSTHAEMMAITNGLYSVVGYFGCGSEHTILIQTDSLGAIAGLSGGVPTKVKGRPRHRASRQIALRFLRIVSGTRVAIRFKHVKAHCHSDAGPRHAVNNWCDNEAKRLMREARDLQPVAEKTISETMESRTW
jgi:ribonuclease HI